MTSPISSESYIRTSDGYAAQKVITVDSTGTAVSSGGSSYSSEVQEYQLNDYTDGTAPNYYGYESSAGAWFIKKIDDSTSPVAVRYSKGTSGYSTAWTNRASQTYDIYGTTF